ncbi:MAG TPA: hypothetical protein VN493_04855 [Thermoanaerobaculia bacterium]|nr:hypothetical protein [Thermoanaerobaculia bacterium]
MSKNDIENVEIEALNDDELESVAGGAALPSETCCCTTGGSNCSNSPKDVESA